jgi:hypothetical protein
MICPVWKIKDLCFELSTHSNENCPKDPEFRKAWIISWQHRRVSAPLCLLTTSLVSPKIMAFFLIWINSEKLQII